VSISTAASPPGSTGTPPSVPKGRRDKTRYLYMAVIVAMLAGIAVGIAFPGKDGFAVGLKPLGTGFINLIKMIITPIIFCTLVLGIGSVRKAASVGKVGGIALGYFLTMSFFALSIGLVVGNLVKPGAGLHLTPAAATAGQSQAADAPSSGVADFFLHLIPDTMVSALTSGNVLQALVIALLVGFALQSMGEKGVPVLRGIGHLQTLVFKVLAMIMWVAPVGVFGAMAAVVGSSGSAALVGLGKVMFAFYVTCAIFVFLILGTILRIFTGISIWKLMKYLAKEYLLIVSTSSSESALPRLIGKMQHLGVSQPVVGVVVPTGYSFNLDGTMIYLTMASLFVAEAVGKPLDIGQQIGLLLFMMLASKGAAGVTGAGLATLAAGLQAHRPELLDGVGLVVGIDRMMSEARAVTNFTGNAVATVLVGTWTGEFDKERAERVLSGLDPFDEEAFAAGDSHAGGAWGDSTPSDVVVDDAPKRPQLAPIG
jgi:aerobic C4-dicarboxylate transport protein